MNTRPLICPDCGRVHRHGNRCTQCCIKYHQKKYQEENVEKARQWRREYYHRNKKKKTDEKDV